MKKIIFILDALKKNNLDREIKGASNAYFKTQVVGGLEPEARYVLDGLAEGIILIVAISQLFSGDINIEGFLLYIYVARLMLGPINEFSSYFIWLQKIFASSERINEYFALETEIKDGNKEMSILPSKINLEVDFEINFSELGLVYKL